ncbi:hypothetical protein F183_A11940 [Bryobacterales bacterium F-183]|nr:hypothetical protein F183_A11940 [Bryobacterales bacterium F-183]
MKGVELLQRNDIEFSALAVVTSETLTDARAFHDFFVSRGIMSIALNIEEIEHQHTTSTLTAPTSVRRFHGFITELYELSQASGLRVREFERARNSIRYFLQTGNGPCISPFYPLSIDYLGNFTVFAPELLGVKHARYGSFALGNVNDDDLDDALDSAAFHAINRDIALGMDMCRANCGYFGVCGGGSPSNKLFENGRLDSMETLYCLLHIKTLVPVVSRGLVVGAQTGGQ